MIKIKLLKLISINFLLVIVFFSIAELVARLFVAYQDESTVYGFIQTKPLPFKNDPDFDLIVKQFDGSCKNKVAKIIYTGKFPYFEDSWSCGGVNFIQGVRRTLPEANSFSAQNKILMFGGSVLWSPGVIDKNTIPSFLQNGLIDKSYEVKNYGFSSVVAKQQLEKLKTVDISKSDLVIFYDGFNDFWQSSMYGNPHGTIIGYNLQNKNAVLITNAKFWLSSNLALYNLLAQIKNMNKKTTDPRKICSVSSALATRNASEYWKVYVDYILEAKAYTQGKGAKFFHILHPTLFSYDNLTTYEKSLRKLRACFIEAKPAYDVYYNNVSNFFKDMPWHLNLSDELKNQDLYFDHAHLAPKGNQLLSEKILNDKNFLKMISE